MTQHREHGWDVRPSKVFPYRRIDAQTHRRRMGEGLDLGDLGGQPHVEGPENPK